MSGKKQERAAKTREKNGRKKNQRIMNTLIVLAVLAVVGWVGYSQFAPETPLPPETLKAIAQGQELFGKNCAACHGKEAEGENRAHFRGGRKDDGGYWAPALNGYAHTWHHPPQMLFSIIKDGSPAEGSPMKGWKDKMTDEEIRAVLTYLRSIWPKSIRDKYEQNHAMH